MATRRLQVASLLVAVGIGAIACALPQSGDRGGAADAADAFLTSLRSGEIEDAWRHLSVETREAIYRNDLGSFRADAGRRDLGEMVWRLGRVDDLDIVWAVHVTFPPGSTVPQFLIDRSIAMPIAADGFDLWIRLPSLGPYEVVGNGLD